MEDVATFGFLAEERDMIETFDPGNEILDLMQKGQLPVSIEDVATQDKTTMEGPKTNLYVLDTNNGVTVGSLPGSSFENVGSFVEVQEDETQAENTEARIDSGINDEWINATNYSLKPLETPADDKVEVYYELMKKFTSLNQGDPDRETLAVSINQELIDDARKSFDALQEIVNAEKSPIDEDARIQPGPSVTMEVEIGGGCIGEEEQTDPIILKLYSADPADGNPTVTLGKRWCDDATAQHLPKRPCIDEVENKKSELCRDMTEAARHFIQRHKTHELATKIEDLGVKEMVIVLNMNGACQVFGVTKDGRKLKFTYVNLTADMSAEVIMEINIDEVIQHAKQETLRGIFKWLARLINIPHKPSNANGAYTIPAFWPDGVPFGDTNNTVTVKDGEKRKLRKEEVVMMVSTAYEKVKKVFNLGETIEVSSMM